MSINFLHIEKISKTIFPWFTGWIIWTLEKLFGATTLNSKLSILRNLNKGTVGHEIAVMLDKRGYRLIPQFENHDIKHIVLDYEMTYEDEIKMQAYLLGNGNYTLPCLIFLSFGIFQPKIWRELITDYRNGKKSNSIHNLTLENCMDKSLVEIKVLYGRHSKISKLSLNAENDIHITFAVKLAVIFNKLWFMKPLPALLKTVIKPKINLIITKS